MRALHPSLYQVNPRVWLAECSRRLNLGRPATLDDVPDAELDQLAGLGVDWLWLLSVWQTGLAGQRASRSNPAVRKECLELLPDGCDADIVGSGFAITAYAVQAGLGGTAALARLRERLRCRGVRLMLDFVPNHTALDHPWVEQHPDRFVPGTAAHLRRAPGRFVRLAGSQGERILAHGRDPYFPPWSDTLQLNYANPATHDAMRTELLTVAAQCDGVRCDMAMLLLPEVFARTWDLPAQPFWPDTIRRVRERFPEFCFLAEVYWDLERTLLDQGFDYAYDKRLYDRLREGQAPPVREHLQAHAADLHRLAHFLENHDEPRAAAVFPPPMHQAAALLTFLTPGLRFFQAGQLHGYAKRVSPHLGRGPMEAADPALSAFYGRLLGIMRRPALRSGTWRLLECAPAVAGDDSWREVIAFTWEAPGQASLLGIVNYAAHPSRCRLPLPGLEPGLWHGRGLLAEAAFEGEAADLGAPGFALELSSWQSEVFELLG